MFLGTNDSYYSYPFKGLVIYFEDGTVMNHPTIMLNLLSIRDIQRVRLLEMHGTAQSVIHEEICKRCIIGVLHLENKVIDYDRSPAGIFKAIAETIILKSKNIESDVETVFNIYAERVTLFDQLQVMVSRYTLTPIKEVRDYAIDKLIREYAIVQRTYPKEVLELQLEKEG